MTVMIDPLRLSLSRLARVDENHSLTAVRVVSDIASSGLIGSSMMMMSPPAAGQRAADRGGEASPAARRLEIEHGGTARRQDSSREQTLEPARLDQCTAVARELARQLQRVAYAHEVGSRIAAEHP